MSVQPREIVPTLAEAIETRRKELGLDVADLVTMSGLTRPGLAPLLRGERRAYQDRLTLPICRVLRWRPDSIHRLLDGQSPITLDDERADTYYRSLAELIEMESTERKMDTDTLSRQVHLRIDRLEGAVSQLGGRRDALQERVTELADQIAGLLRVVHAQGAEIERMRGQLPRAADD